MSLQMPNRIEILRRPEESEGEFLCRIATTLTAEERALVREICDLIRYRNLLKEIHTQIMEYGEYAYVYEFQYEHTMRELYEKKQAFYTLYYGRVLSTH